MLIPCLDKLPTRRTQVVFRGKVDDAQAVPLDKAEPLFDLIHPRTLPWGERHDKPLLVG